MHDPKRNDDGCSAWNPGIAPGVPAALRPLDTLFRPENAFTGADTVAAWAELTGLPDEELTVFRPARLALHEVIVRVTADLAVAEGEQEEQFGRNFRAIATRLLELAVRPHLAAIEAAWEGARDDVARMLDRELDATLFAPPPDPVPPGFWAALFGRRGASGASASPSVSSSASASASNSPAQREEQILLAWRAAAGDEPDPLRRTVLRSLHRVLGAIAVRRGRLPNDRELLRAIVAGHAANAWGAQRVAQELGPRLDAAVVQAGFVRVPKRDKPILISLKGASAAGKSSLRPMVKQLMREQGIEPDGYATISPDVWRRLLLDYDTLGPHYKYAGPLTSRELMVVDGKLDRYIRRKAQREGGIPHLLVDRFRFDSFESEKVARVLHDTYARHVDTLIMYFVVTPPEETVERGWQRALERGRYKAVEDFLGHSVEAYAGMPKLLFKWLAHARPEYRFFFLDNRVPKGSFPKTIAFGTQGAMTVLDPDSLLDIERYTKIDVHATCRAAVHPPAVDRRPAANAGFLRDCLRRIARVDFVDPQRGTTWAEVRHGTLQVIDPAALDAPDRRALVEALRD
jgi:hypothetical protein